VPEDGNIIIDYVTYLPGDERGTRVKTRIECLIDESSRVVMIATCDRNDAESVPRYEKTLGFEEVKGTSGREIWQSRPMTTKLHRRVKL
jgi:hypothetical protein